MRSRDEGKPMEGRTVMKGRSTEEKVGKAVRDGERDEPKEKIKTVEK